MNALEVNIVRFLRDREQRTHRSYPLVTLAAGFYGLDCYRAVERLAAAGVVTITHNAHGASFVEINYGEAAR